MTLLSACFRARLQSWITTMICGLSLCVCPSSVRAQVAFRDCASPLEAPALLLTPDGQRAHITFEGFLESADNLQGPWIDVPNAVSPFTLDLVGPQRFLRARSTAVENIFDSCSVVPLTLRGPLQTHFDLAFAGTPDGIFPPLREKPYFNGTVQFAGFELPITLRVRGNSSLQECPFPKLKLKVSKKDRASTPFADAREIKIGTHCAEGGQGTIGRLRDQTATFREALAYEIMTHLGFTAPRVRRAQIEYRDNSPSNDGSPTGWHLARSAFILEDIEVVGERMGGRALDDDEVAALTDAGFAENLITALRLLHTLLGNWDYALSADGRGLWNTDVIVLASGQLIPVAGDFDLASWVTGVVRSSAPRDYHPDLEAVEREARYAIELIQKDSRPEDFESARARFLLERTAIESHVAEASVDPAGRANALRHLAAFFDALSDLPPE